MNSRRATDADALRAQAAEYHRTFDSDRPAGCGAGDTIEDRTCMDDGTLDEFSIELEQLEPAITAVIATSTFPVVEHEPRQEEP